MPAHLTPAAMKCKILTPARMTGDGDRLKDFVVQENRVAIVPAPVQPISRKGNPIAVVPLFPVPTGYLIALVGPRIGVYNDRGAVLVEKEDIVGDCAVEFVQPEIGLDSVDTVLGRSV